MVENVPPSLSAVAASAISIAVSGAPAPSTVVTSTGSITSTGATAILTGRSFYVSFRLLEKRLAAQSKLAAILDFDKLHFDGVTRLEIVFDTLDVAVVQLGNV